MTESIPQLGIPNLGGVITPDDISTKGTGSYAADYVNWAKIAHLLHVHAPGWQFALRPNANGDHIWTAPDGSGYVVGYFTNGHQQTPDFPQACMDNRNGPIQAERITARVLTDTHRRCLCTAAAFSFGLAYELWAKVEVENPMRDDDAAPAVASASKPSGRAVVKKTGAPSPVTAGPSVLGTPEWQQVTEQLRALPQPTRERLLEAFKKEFAIAVEQGQMTPDYINTPAKLDFFKQQLNELKAAATA